MSEKGRRVKANLDYNILHKTGKKVYKSNNMELNDKKVKELQICEDIKEFFVIYELGELETAEDINEGLVEINALGKQYRHIHVELKAGMGEKDYGEGYEKYEETCESIRNFVKFAKEKIKVLKKDVEESEENKLRNSLLIEEEVFREKLETEIDKVDFDDSEEVRASCSRFENLLENYYTLLSRVKIAFGEKFNDECKPTFDKTIERINEQIRTGKSKTKEFDIEMQKSLNAEKTENTKLQKDAFIKEQKFHAKILCKEIEMRCTSLIEKCNVSGIKDMSDFQILECQKNMRSFDCEMREIFDKVTEYSKVASLCEDGDAMLTRPRNFQEKALDARNDFAKSLYAIFTERDISEEKLKTASVLSIELAKFKGYESKLDVYSFRTEFEKLIQPTIQKKYWLDVLKKNYLTGAALTLVEKSETIEEIWKKLINAYGNVKLLLQNKISNLDKLENLEKIKGDEKLGNALAKIINMMTELSNLAQKHNLEYKLYVGGGLEKVYGLIGEQRERKFLSKSLDRKSEKSDTTKVLDTKTDTSKVSDWKSSAFDEKDEWENLLAYLKKELALREKMTLVQKSKTCMGLNPTAKPYSKEKSDKNHFDKNANTAFQIGLECHICGKKDHIISTDQGGKSHVDYFSCKTFVKMSPKERCAELQKKKLCLQCLRPGMKYDERHICYKKYACPDSYHCKYPKGIHVLLCDAHKKDKANIDLLEEYKNRVISKRSDKFENFTRTISLMCFNEVKYAHSNFGEGIDNVIPDIFESAIFMLQTISVGGIKLNLFYDTGCGDIVVKASAMDALAKLGRAKMVVPGPITMSGVGDLKSECEHGIYSICLPLRNGQNAVFSGVCLDRVTTSFPKYALKDVEKDVLKQCKKQGGAAFAKSIPTLSKEVGGDTDILIGIKYLRYHPQRIWESSTGLSMFKSWFLSADGTTGVIGGPHASFTETERCHKKAHACDKGFTGQSNLIVPSYYTEPLWKYRDSVESCIGISGIFPQDSEHGNNNMACGNYQTCMIEGGHTGENSSALVARKPPKCVKAFDELDISGTEVSFRCPDCRNCDKCKKSPKVDAISIQEEIEQNLIEKCVQVDIVKGITTAKLPFVTNPDVRLEPNDKIAHKIYEQQVATLANKPEDRMAVIASEAKLQALGFVEFVSNLSDDEREVILNNLRYFIPWRVHFNPNSRSTYCRLVFDASATPRGKCSLNSLVGKGKNNMNNLVMILIRWMCNLHAFHTDISKMYNAIRLHKAHWRYQLYLWENDLNPNLAPRWKCIKTVIYGVKSSGNLAECGLRKTAELTRSQCPKAYDVIMNDIYVDDCLSGKNSHDEMSQTTDQLSVAVSHGGFSLKGFTFSGKDPPEHLSNADGKSVTVGGLTWFSKKDSISVKVPELNFGKKVRGKKPESTAGKMPDKLTMRNCVSAVYEVFDPVGYLTPLTSGFKIDINQLTLRKLSWDDEIPDDLKQIWSSNFEMIQEIRHIKFRRAVVPEDAVDLNIDTIDTADASQQMICVAIYARFRRKSGGYSCQLIFARSKVVPKNMSMPRAELMAASLNASTGHIVKTALGKRHGTCWKLTDSQVVLHWIGSVRSKLKMWVRNRVIEINRLVDLDRWRYVSTENMIADLGTRKGVTVQEVSSESKWIKGLYWMPLDEKHFPVKTISEIVLCSESKREVSKESIIIEVIDDRDECQPEFNVVHTPCHVPNTVGLRYTFSQYLIDPNRFRFRRVIRILGLVLLYIKNVRKKMGKQNLQITESSSNDLPDILSYQWDRYIVTTGKTSGNMNCRGGLVVELCKNMINASLNYYFKKATEEVKHFLPESKYRNISTEKNGVLYYTGRILPTQEVGGALTLCDVSLDLSKGTFCVPIVDRLSPLAYAIANEIHWYHPDVKHKGLETVLRQVQCVAHIIEGRILLKSIKNACIRCRLLNKREVEVTMGPKHSSNLCIAPAFHDTQVDLCGPFESYSNANKRAKLKIWFVVFCCSTTGTVDCKVMENYSTDSFVLAFIRFSCQYGYPCNLYPDYGSQLIKGCKDMVLSFSDIKNRLSIEYGVEFYPCPVGAHYVHGKVERKIREIKKCIEKEMHNNRLSIVQWETLGQQISNSMNNMPIGLGNKTQCLENLDILTPNRLILGRNNNRCPTAPLVLCHDIKKIISRNSDIFNTWFRSWLVSYVPTLVPKPKWFRNDRNVSIGDIVLFTKSDKEFENLYQYGIIVSIYPSKDGHIRSVDIEYKNHNEQVKRATNRGVREIVVIHPIDELGISRELHDLASNHEKDVCICNVDDGYTSSA